MSSEGESGETGWTRRALLLRAGRLVMGASGGALLAPVGCSEPDPLCFDPELLSTPERALRTSQGYRDESPHAEARRCGGCQFYRPARPAGCGECEILGGPVSEAGHCNAWSAARTS